MWKNMRNCLLLFICILSWNCSNDHIHINESEKMDDFEVGSTLASNLTTTQTESLETEASLPTSSVYPLETNNPEEVESTTEFLIGLLDYTGDCGLPCYFGVVPGETSITDVKNSFEPIAYSYVEREGSIDITIQVEKEFNPPAEFIILKFNYDENGFVTDIYAPAGSETGYGLSDLMGFLGSPDRVLVDTSASGPKEAFEFRYIQYYAKQNLVALYLHRPVMDESSIKFCPNSDDAPIIMVSNPANAETFMDILRRFFPTWTNSYSLLEEISDYSTSRFFDTYQQENDDTCILISQSKFDIW